MSALLSLIFSNTTILALLCGLVAVVVAFMKGRTSGASKERLKNLQEKSKNHDLIIRDVNRAAEAGARVGTASADRLRDDPFNRDNAGRR